MLRNLARAVVAALAVVASVGPTGSQGSQQDSATVWDFVVVGAGTGGALCAARLAAEGADVLLLEAGKWDEDWLYNVASARDRNTGPQVWAYPTRLPGRLSVQNSGPMRSKVAAGKMMGGSSAVHGDYYDPPPVREFEYHGLKSWDAATVRAALSKIEASLTLNWVGVENLDDVPDAQFYVIDKLMTNMPLKHLPRGHVSGDKGGLVVGWHMYRSCVDQVACKKRRHTSYSDLIPKLNASSQDAGDGTSGRRSLTVLADALVARVLLEGGEAVGVEWQRHGVLHEAYAHRGVILAAGAVGTPKILTLSGIGDPFELQRLGIPVQVPNREVGQGLADHLAMFSWFMITGGDILDLKGLTCEHKEWFNIFFNLTGPATGGDGHADAEVRFFTGCNATRKTVDFGVEAVLLHPESRGRVAVPSANPAVMPVVEFPSLWERDFDRLEAIYRRLAEALGLQAEDFAQDRGRPLSETARSESYLYQHLCCSARAAPIGEPGVCDENLQVRGVEGLYVADASALPFTPSAHTSAPALLMAELAAASALASPSRRTLPGRARDAMRSQTAATRGARLEDHSPLVSLQAEVPTVQLLSPSASKGGAASQPSPVALPLAGLGTGTMSGSRVTGAVATFLRLGGRHLDTAVMYDNYAEVRAGIGASGLQDTSSVVITWKVMPFGRDYVHTAVGAAIRGLGVSSLDIALLHWPGDVANGKLLHGEPLPACVKVDGDPARGVVAHSWRRCREESYTALVEEYEHGRVRTIGVSNFAGKHLDELVAYGRRPPAVHQLELHPLWHEDDLLSRHEADGTRVQAFGCLGGKHTGASLLRQPGFRKIADRRGVTPAQVLLRWAVQRGASVIAGGSSEAHLADNLKVFGFELSPDEMEFMDSMPREAMNKMYGPLPDDIL